MHACSEAYEFCCKLFAGASSPLQRPLAPAEEDRSGDKGVKLVTIRLGLQHPTTAMRVQAIEELGKVFESENAPAVSEGE